MPSDVTIRGVSAVSASGSNTAGQRNAIPDPVATARTTTAASPVPNPNLLLDPGLGVVVIEFRDQVGIVTNSIPSQRQIQAYRLWEETRVGPPPPLT